MSPVLAAEWQVGQVFLAMLWLALFVIWLWLIIAVFVDVLASRDLSGLAKALWVLFLVLAPYFGVFVYLIARGNRMIPVSVRFGLPTRNASAERRVLTHEQVDAIARLSGERDRRLISAEEYRARRDEILA